MFRKLGLLSSRYYICLVMLVALGLYGGAAADVPDILVSQKGRKFDPLSVDIAKGAALVIENDDGDLVHHAYIEADAFNFDSGDQQPGSRTRVVFPIAGDFKVLCGIHPKMKLLVHVH